MKEKELIELLQKQNGYITIDTMSAQLKCSSSALRKLFKEINSFDYGCIITNKRNLGYALEIHDAEKFQSYVEQLHKDNSSIIYDHNYRMQLILFYLLQHSEGITIEALMENIPVSKSTMLKDLDEVAEILNDYQLQLLRRKHYGLFIQGEEVDIRRAYAKYVLKFSFLSNPMPEYVHVFADKEREQLKTTLIKTMKDKSLMLTDTILENVVMHVEVLTMRIKKEKYLVDQQSTYAQVDAVYKEVANTICAYLKEHYDVYVPDVEISYLSAVIAAKASIGTKHMMDQQLLQDIKTILKKLDKEFLTAFAQDEELAQTLTFHVYPLLNRLYYNMQLDNPLVDDINMEFASTISVACRFAQLIEKSYHFQLSMDEISFIALHFAAYAQRQQMKNLKKAKRIVVVCGTGGGSAQLIKLKMESLFSDAIIVTTSIHQLSEFDYELPDLFLSTIPFGETYNHIPVIHIKQFLDGEELEKIKESASLYLSQKELNPSFLQISSLFKKDLFTFSEDEDYLDIIWKQAKKVVEQGYGNKTFPTSVMEREKRFTTIYTNGIAGPHAMNFSAKENAIAVVILAHPIYYQEKEIQVIFLINLKKSYLFLHKEISKVILKIIQDQSLNQRIRSAHTFEQFMKEINRLLK